jgi:hypothetical protein
MKHFLLFFFLFFSFKCIQSQAPYGHEWIDPEKPHYKIALTQSKLYRIPYTTLQNIAPEIANANSNEICIFNNGVKIPIFISWNILPTSNDYIEFYGEVKDGTVDNKLYKNPDFNLNPIQSYFLDSNFYFLTLRSNNEYIQTSPIDTSNINVTSSYCVRKEQVGFRNSFQDGRRFYYSTVDYVVSPVYDEGEGWGNNAIASNNIVATQAKLDAPYTSKLKFRLFAKNANTHQLEVIWNVSKIRDTSFFGSKVITYETNINTPNLLSTNALKINPKINNNHGYALGFIELNYPRTYNFAGLQSLLFYSEPNTQMQKFNASNFVSNNTSIILTNFTKKKRFVIPSSSNFTGVIDSGSTESQLFITNESQINLISSLRKVSFPNIKKGNFIIITNKFLTKDSNNLNVIDEYKSYKESNAGGNFKVSVVYQDELDDMFAFGHPKHPLSIRKFLQLAHTWKDTSIENVLLIGKSYAPHGLRGYNSALYNSLQVTSFGHFPSDNLLATMDSSVIPFVNIGRLSVFSPYDVRNYLDKLKEYNAEYNKTAPLTQNPENKEYMKWVIHLGGGTGTEQQQNFKANLKEFEQEVKDTLTGARVFSLFKNGTDIAPDETAIDLENRINKGVSLITFFGHSSATVFDVGITDPGNFKNKGKYPVFLANGCNSGNVYSSSPSYSEQFINGKQKGAIGFIASTNFALDASLYNYSKWFYRHLNTNHYNSTIGELTRQSTISLVNEVNFNLNYLYTTALEYNINGDPSVPMSQYNLPDYYIDKNSFYINPKVVSATMDSFSVFVMVQNLGKAIKRDIKLKLERINNGASTQYEKVVSATYFKDTFEVKIPVKEQNLGLGLNTFNIKIEADDEIAEISESNNEVKNGLEVLIEAEDIYPIFPYEFSVIGNDSLTLYSSITNLSKTPKKYLIQLDTTELFNSPILRTHETITEGSVFSWYPNTALQDSTVYYWRTGIDSSYTKKAMMWHTSSFIYLKGKTKGGWNQSQYFQYKKDNFTNLQLKNDRSFQFLEDLKNIYIRVDGSSTTNEVEWYLNSARVQVFRESGRIGSGLNVIWIDGKTGIAKQSNDVVINGARYGSYGSIQFGFDGIPREGFVFPDTGMTPATHPTPNTKWTTVFMNFINQVPTGDYLIFYTLKRPDYTKWDNTLTSFFTNAGLQNITNFTNGTIKAPLIFGYRKNDPSYTPYQVNGTDFITKTYGNINISGNWNEGGMSSTIIGPVKKWGSYHHKLLSMESPSKDTNMVYIYGLDNANRENLLFSLNSDIVDTSLSSISASQYPKLKLKYYSKDNTNRNPSQIGYWRVLYEEDVPEILVNKDFYFELKDSIFSGESTQLGFGVTNVSPANMDSFWVKMILTSGSQNQTFTQKVAPINSLQNGKINFTIPYPNYFVRNNQIQVEINPKGTEYLTEKYDFNNFLQSSFYARPDEVNPLLDVTFDGVHILNNELVSSKPQIQIQLKDENEFLLLNDTSLIQLYLKDPQGNTNPIYFAENNIQFTAATNSKNNVAIIQFTPTLTDGKYELIVKDADKSGNSSGKNARYDYKIGFRVITKMQVSQVLNYPNPFSTSTQFIFTLTGEKIPDRIKIQILNIRGQVVREIQKEELGPLKIGLNRTAFAWNGTDQYGDRLANGVYLYKVVVMDNNKPVDMLNSSDFKDINNSKSDISKYFEHNYGKMVILR